MTSAPATSDDLRDASLAAKWLFDEPYSEQAVALVVAATRERQQLVAPHLLTFEITNIIRQRMRRMSLSVDEAQEQLRFFSTFPVLFSAPRMLSADALTVADRYNLPTAYDAHYVALAQQLGCSLWTDDQRLIQTLAGRLPFVRWIGDYSEGETQL